MQNDIKYLHAFASIPSIGSKTLLGIKGFFPSFEDAWRASENEFRNAGIDEKAIAAIAWKRPSIDPDRNIETLIRQGIWILSDADPTYPSLLHEIPNPPFVLYGRGQPQSLWTPLSIGVVGTRKPTS
jgi:DNA processing protein